MTRTINNWKPVVRSIFTLAISEGLKIVGVDNGDDEGMIKTETIAEALSEATATDEAYIYFEDSTGQVVWVHAVLGNDPEETISNYGDCPILDTLHSKHIDKWEGRKCPTKQIETKY